MPPLPLLSHGLYAGIAGLALLVPAGANEPVPQAPPRATADYALRATTTPDGWDLRLAYSDNRMRIDVEATAGVVVSGLLDFDGRTMIVFPSLPGADRVAVEIEMPNEYVFADMPADSVYLGADTVNSEPCEIWRTRARPGAVPVEACIAADGVPLRAEVTVDGRVISYHASELERLPQAAAQFEVPKGVRVTRLPKALKKMIPGLGQ